MTNIQFGSMNQRTARRLALGLGWLSTIAILAASLALQDIYHGEADLTLEWTVLRISFLVIVAFHVVALIALRKTIRDPDAGQTDLPAGRESTGLGSSFDGGVVEPAPQVPRSHDRQRP